MAEVGTGKDNIGLGAGLAEIYRAMSRARRRQLFLVLLLMIAGAAAELGTIGAVIPFLTLLSGQRGSQTATHGHLAAILADPWPQGTSPLLVTAAIFAIVALLAGIIRVQLAWSSRSFIFRLGHDLAVEIQRRVLQQPFISHIHRNSSTLVAALAKSEILATDVLFSLMQAFTGAIIGGIVIAFLLAISPVTTFAAVAAFALIYGLISSATRHRLAVNSDDVELAYDERLKTVQESAGGIRDVIIDNSQRLYLRDFQRVDERLAVARITNQFIAAAPRYLVEMVAMVVVAVIAVVIAYRDGGIVPALPMLGALALGAQRLLPLAQQVFIGWSTLAGLRSIFGQTIALLRLPAERQPSDLAVPLPLNRAIAIERLSFTYPTRKHRAVDGVSMAISKGCMIALQGPTGSGKSTLLDLIMGLLDPEEGRIMIDDVELGPATVRRWHRAIAHVPQSIFLADTTIAANIALSLPDSAPDQGKIVGAAKLAQLHDFIVSLPAGYETRVGERGIRLSGGQRQRLGIARAVYKDTPILVLDEATSALDDFTETAVITALDELKRKGRTVIIVAHRLSTIRHCDAVARIENGRLVDYRLAAELSETQRGPG